MEKITAALAKAQAAITAPNRNREVTVRQRNGGTYSFRYTTLDALIEHIRPHIAANGLWFTQSIENNVMTTRIHHASGECIECTIPMPPMPPNPQECGSIVTYFRRYSLQLAFGLASDEDDDANIASGNEYTVRAKADDNANQQPITEEEIEQLMNMLHETDSDMLKLFEHQKIPKDRIEALTHDEYTRAMNALMTKRRIMRARRSESEKPND